MPELTTAQQQAAKAARYREAQRQLARSEARCNAHLARYLADGRRCTPEQSTEWQAEQARWDQAWATVHQCR